MNKHTTNVVYDPAWYPYCDLDVYVTESAIEHIKPDDQNTFIDLILKYNPKETFMLIKNIAPADREEYARTYSKNPEVKKAVKKHRGWMYRQQIEKCCGT